MERRTPVKGLVTQVDTRVEASRDEGSGTLAAVGVSALLLCAGLVSWAVVEGVIAHQRASVAADLSAVAGAARVAGGGEDPCGIAGRIAGANGGRLEYCVIEGSDVVVRVVVPPPPLLSRLAASAGQEAPSFQATARAGEHRVEEEHGTPLVERLVAVAALGRLDA